MAKNEEGRKLTAAEKKAAKQSKREAKANKPGFFKGVKSEMKKITWYPKKATLVNTAWVGAALILLAVVTGLVDAGLSKGLELLGSLFA